MLAYMLAFSKFYRFVPASAPGQEHFKLNPLWGYRIHRGIETVLWLFFSLWLQVKERRVP